LTLLLIGVGLPLSFGTPLFRGFADLDARGVYWASFFAFLTAAAAMVTANLVFLYGEVRINGGEQPVPQRLSSRQAWWVFDFGMLLYLALLVKLWSMKSAPGGQFVLFAAGGFAAGFALIVGVTITQEFFGKSTEEGPYLVFPFDRAFGLNRFFRIFTRIESRVLERGPLAAASRSLFNRFIWLGPGYIQYTPNPGGLLPGHIFAGFLTTATVAIYLVQGYLQFNELSDYKYLQEPRVPTIAYVLTAILIGCWILSATALFWDRFRTPVLLVVAVWMFLVGSLPSSPEVSNHIFDTRALDSDRRNNSKDLATPYEIFTTAPDDKLLVVSAARGAI
jgi:hypothetical protein